MTDDVFLRRFFDCTLSREEWTHRAHIKTAYLLLMNHPLEEAIDRIRTGIQALNAALGVEESVTSGYNETTTVAFMHIVDAVKRANATIHPVESADAFCDAHPELLTKHILRLYYSPERRMHPDAKRHFVEPDLAPLPTCPPGADS